MKDLTLTWLHCVCLLTMGFSVVSCENVERGGGNSAALNQRTRTFALTPKPAEIQRLETAVIEEGHQPWRLDPLGVAQAELAGLLGAQYGFTEEEATKVSYTPSSWHLRPQDDTHCRAAWQFDGGEAVLALKNSRPQGDGIWYAESAMLTGIESPNNAR